MNILITGGRGQLGLDLTAALSESHTVTAVDLPELNITDESAVAGLLGRLAPQVVVNCAAFTRVDDCEHQSEAAWLANATGPRILARALAPSRARLIQISTDYVFDGQRRVPEPYTESDAPRPLSQYGRSKLAGEQAVLDASADNAVVRTAWLYGAGGPNFLKTMLRLALDPDRSEIRVVNDQFGSPTWSWRLARQIGRLVESGGSGIYHATAEGYGSWYDLARHFLGCMDVPCRLVPCTSAEYPTPARRPANSILDNRRLRSEGIWLMQPWRDDVARFAREHGERLRAEVTREGS